MADEQPKKKRFNTQNLRVLSPSEARENGRKGGRASAAKAKRRKSLKELFEVALAAKGPDGKTTAEGIVAAMCAQALEGNVRAFVEIRDTIGEKPAEKVEVTGDVAATLMAARKRVEAA